MARTGILLLILTALAGCSGIAARRPGMPSDAARLARLTRLGDVVARGAVPGDTLDFGLSERDALGAWSWPDGRIRVSRGLADLLDDDQLAAAIAHEIGHLLDGGHVAGTPAALDGRHDRAASESRADVLGCRVLGERGAQALPRMLRKVAAALGDEADGPDPALLLRRAEAADAFCVAGR